MSAFKRPGRLGDGGAERVGWGLRVILVFALLIGVTSLRYLLPEVPGAPPHITANPYAGTGALALHAGAAAVALMLGPFQFMPRLRRARPWRHRTIGTVYVAACLVGGLSGLLLALGATTGPISTAGFGGLAVFWLVTTGNAGRLARAGRFAEHRRWMIRSFALTLAAVTLRLYTTLSVPLGLDFETAYRAIAFLCWVPNLIIAELYLALRRAA